MNDRTFVYVLHIATTPVTLWQSLTSNDAWQQYWYGEWRVDSDWKLGSSLKFFTADGTLYSEGEIVVAEPPKTLIYSWPEPDAPADMLPEVLTWQIVPSGPAAVKLTLIHENLSEAAHQGVSQGWPAILSSLKSLLEVGQPLVFNVKR